MLDVSVNKPFKDAVRELFEKHISENLHQHGKYASFFPKKNTNYKSAEGWEKVKQNTDMVTRSFGISDNLDGTEDDGINIKGTPGYRLLEPEK